MESIAWPSSHAPLVADEAVQSRTLTEDDLFPITNMLRPAAPKWKEIGGALGIVNSDLRIMIQCSFQRVSQGTSGRC